MSAPERDLGGARLVFRGSAWLARTMLGTSALVVVVLLAAMLTDGVTGAPAAIIVGIFGLLLGGSWAAFRWMAPGAEVWAGDEALLVRRRRGRWLRVPWSEIRGGTWIHDRRLNAPAITTTGGPYDRPNPDWYTTPCQPLLAAGWRVAAHALRDEFERRGIPWAYEVEERWTENKWTSTRWDW